MSHALALSEGNRTPFTGRARLLTLLDETVANSRLSTLVGPGGVGKTRLVRHWARSFAQDARFCDLSAARSEQDVHLSIALAMGIELAEADALALLCRALQARPPALVILDNAEAALAAVASTVGAILTQAPSTALIVTSREPLNLNNEAIVRVEPLSVDEAAAMFVAAAAQRDKRFVLSDDKRSALLDIVERLDCLPLAIELCAARTPLLSLEALRLRLGQPGTSQTLLLDKSAPARHASLYTVIDDTWQQLSDAERAALSQCALFAGPFDLMAAEAIIDSQGEQVLQIVERLCDRSLLAVRHTPSGRTQLRMYAAVLDYLLKEAPLNDAPLRQRHGRYYAQRAAATNLALDEQREVFPTPWC